MDNRSKYFIFAALAAFMVYARLADHPANFAPVAAAGIFLTTYLGRKWGVAAVLAGMFLSDFVIGFYDPRLMLAVYGSFVVVALFGRLLKRNSSFTEILGVSILASILYFVVTNGAVWAITPAYSKDAAGLLEAYVMGLPFFRNSLLGDLFFSTSFFGLAKAMQYASEKRLVMNEQETKI